MTVSVEELFFRRAGTSAPSQGYSHAARGRAGHPRGVQGRSEGAPRAQLAPDDRA